MANRLKQNLENVVVVLAREQVSGTTSDEISRLFRCETGMGTYSSTTGTTIQGRFLNNPVHGEALVRIDGMEDIERLATPREIEVGKK